MVKQNKEPLEEGHLLQQPENYARLPLHRGRLNNYPNILLIDDETPIRKTYERILEEKKYNLISVSTPKSAMRRLRQYKNGIDTILCDIKMPTESIGFDLLHKIRKEYSYIPVIMLTVLDEFETVIKALNYGAFAYIKKSSNYTEIFDKINEALEKKRKFENQINLLTGLASDLLEYENRDQILKKHPEIIQYLPPEPTQMQLIPYDEVLTNFDKNYNFFHENVDRLLSENKDLIGKYVVIEDKKIIRDEKIEALATSLDSLQKYVYSNYGNVGVYIPKLEKIGKSKEDVKIVRSRYRVVR